MQIGERALRSEVVRQSVDAVEAEVDVELRYPKGYKHRRDSHRVNHGAGCFITLMVTQFQNPPRLISLLKSLI